VKTSTLPTFEAFMQEPETAFKLYRDAITFMEVFGPLLDEKESHKSDAEAFIAQVMQQIRKSQDQSEQALEIANQATQSAGMLREALEKSTKTIDDAVRQAQESNENTERATKLTEAAITQRDEYRKMAEEAQAETSLLNEKYARAQFRILQLERMIFGRRSEKFTPEQLTQLRLDIEAEEVATCSIVDMKEVSGYKKFTTITEPKKHPGRNPLPAHLRRENIRLEPFDKKESDVFVREEVTEVLEYNPGEFFVKAFIRPIYAERNDDGSTIMKQADMPVQAIDKCIAGASLLAYIVISKYIDSLPLYRQIEIFKRVGVDIASGTMSGWITKVCELLEPLCELLKKEVLKAEYLNIDETTMKVIEKGAKTGKTHLGYYWVYLHHWGKLVFYDYKATRQGKEPESILKDYKGYIQADAYAAYEGVAKKNGNILLCCMAHARRKFEEVFKNSDKRAGVILEKMNRLYAYEEEWRNAGLTFDQIKSMRQKYADPILDEIEQWLKAWQHSRDIDAPLRGAINYTLKIWDKLRIYTTNGMLSIDNNAVERAIRTVAIGRKNYLFSGSHEGARRSAMLYSLMISCKLNGINPQVYLPDVLTRLSYLPKEDKYLELLLPNNWQPKLEGALTAPVNEPILNTQ
jgi:transposase